MPKCAGKTVQGDLPAQPRQMHELAKLGSDCEERLDRTGGGSRTSCTSSFP